MRNNRERRRGPRMPRPATHDDEWHAPPPPYNPYEGENPRAEYTNAPGGPQGRPGAQYTTQDNGTSRRDEASPLNADFAGHGYQARQPSAPKHWPDSESSTRYFRRASTQVLCIRLSILVTWFIWLVAFCVQSHRLAAYPPSPAEFDAYKAKWARENTLHQRDYDQWAHDRAAFEEERQAYEAARKGHELDKDNWARQRQAYEEDTGRWRRAMDGYELARRRWAEEQISWARERTRQQRAWREEQAGWAREREEREKEWHGEAGRHRMHEGNILGLSWGTVDAHQCIRYGTRKYTARLGLNLQEACQHMPVVVNGEVVGVPDECVNEGDTLVGHWHLTESEVECRPSWGDLYDKGCIGQGSGKHRFEARLWNLHNDEDWMQMCATTPADVYGHHFDGPTHCENRGVLYGIVGMWEVDDNRCN